MRIRTAKESDYEQVARVKRQSWVDAYEGVLEDDFINSIKNGDAYEFYPQDLYKLHLTSLNSPFFVCENEETIVGFCQGAVPPENDYLPDEYAEIVILYIHPEHQGQGIGSSLLETTVERLGEVSEADKVALGCFERNLPAREFYETRGFTDGWRTTRQIRDTEYSMVVYEKSL